MKFNLNDKLIQITEVVAGKGIHKTVDPKKKKTFCKREKNKEAYFGRLLDRAKQRVTARLSCSPYTVNRKDLF